ncbi:MAG: lamin tail domain-containing protein [Myxococcales bacterium]|nr:lamin tail domain-containing protein [Myxococcales bacterium]
MTRPSSSSTASASAATTATTSTTSTASPSAPASAGSATAPGSGPATSSSTRSAGTATTAPSTPPRAPTPNSERPQDFTFNDEFIELLNTTDRPIDLSLWVIAAQDDFVTGLYPGTIIGPYERFLIVDHNVEAYDDLRPQMPGGAYTDPDFVMNMANDQRFLRLNLSNARLQLRLLDPRGNVVDVAGDGGAPFAGGRERIPGGATDDPRALRVRSMERVHFDCADGDTDCRPIRDGRDPASWRSCTDPTEAQTAQIREGYEAHVIATPGQPNSGGEAFPDEDPAWRAPDPEIDEETQPSE